MAPPAEDTEIQLDEPPVELFSQSKTSRLQFCLVCRHVTGALVLGLVAGGSAGSCTGAVAAEMLYFFNGTAASQTGPTEPNSCLKSTAYVTYVYLLAAILATAAGLLCGQQVHHLLESQRWSDTPGRALALAGPVAVLGIAVTGAALGSIAEKLIFVVFPSFPAEFLSISVPHQTYVMIIILCLLPIVNHSCVFIGLLLALIITGASLFHSMTSLSGFVPLVDIDSIFPLFFASLLISNKTPRIISTLLLVAMSTLPYEGEPVPVDAAEVVSPVSHVLKRLFIVRLGVQMFQASCGPVLFSRFVAGAAHKVCVSAVAAAAGVLAALWRVYPILGTGASLGGLVAASGAAGVALCAAGELGQSYGGHAGRAGATLGAAVGAFLPLATQDVKFVLLVSLCAAAIPGSPYLLLGLDFFYSLHPLWHVAMLCTYVPVSVFIRLFFSAGIYIIVPIHFTIVVHRLALIDTFLHRLVNARLTSLNVEYGVSVDPVAANSGAISEEARKGGRLKRLKDSKLKHFGR